MLQLERQKLILEYLKQNRKATTNELSEMLGDGSQLKDLTDAAKQLSDGAKNLSDGYSQASEASQTLVNGAKTLMGSNSPVSYTHLTLPTKLEV